MLINRQRNILVLFSSLPVRKDVQREGYIFYISTLFWLLEVTTATATMTATTLGMAQTDLMLYSF